MRGATGIFFIISKQSPISTHTPLARRDPVDSVAPADTFISTHTPLARRDQSVLPRRRISLNFYSHASCEARHTHEIKEEDLIDFYSHASCEARQSMSIKFEVNLNFYSHASCEARQMQPEQNANLQLFLLTRLLRGATHDQRKYNTYRYISTHTPLARRARNSSGLV